MPHIKSFEEFLTEKENLVESDIGQKFNDLSTEEQIVFLAIIQRKPAFRLDFVNSKRDGNLNLSKEEYDEIVQQLIKKGLVGKGYRIDRQVKKKFTGIHYQVRNGKVITPDDE